MTDSNSSKTLSEVIQGNYNVSIGEYLNIGKQIFQKNIAGFIAYNILVIIFNVILQNIPRVGAALVSILNPIIRSGFFVVAFKLLQNKSTSSGDFFQGYKNWIHLILAGFTVVVFTVIGTLLFILPGIYLSISYFFTLPLIIDRQVSFWEAMKTSRKIITPKWFSWFGFGLLLFLINIVGLLIFGIGVLVTGPLTVCAQAVAYQQVVGLRNQNL
jgi:uncharacterized membrane protein